MRLSLLYAVVQAIFYKIFRLKFTPICTLKLFHYISDIEYNVLSVCACASNYIQPLQKFTAAMVAFGSWTHQIWFFVRLIACELYLNWLCARRPSTILFAARKLCALARYTCAIFLDIREHTRRASPRFSSGVPKTVVLIQKSVG